MEYVGLKLINGDEIVGKVSEQAQREMEENFLAAHPEVTAVEGTHFPGVYLDYPYQFLRVGGPNGFASIMLPYIMTEAEGPHYFSHEILMLPPWELKGKAAADYITETARFRSNIQVAREMPQPSGIQVAKH